MQNENAGDVPEPNTDGPEMEPSDIPEPTTEETIKRPTKGGDGGESEHIIERDKDGNVTSKTHRVTKDGEIIHQHQDHVGKSGKYKRFPNEWLKNPTINE